MYNLRNCLFCILSIWLSLVHAQEQEYVYPDFEEEVYDTLFVDLQQSFRGDKVVLFINGVQVLDKNNLHDEPSRGKVIGEKHKFLISTDTLHLTYYYYEKNHWWSCGNNIVYSEPKKLDFTIIPSIQGKYLGLATEWDSERGSYWNERLERWKNMFPKYYISQDPFVYY